MSKYNEERHDWTRAEAEELYNQPFNELLFQAQTVHRRHFDPNKVQLSRLLSIKTGGCAEDCAYCSQSAHYSTGLSASKLMEVERVIAEARKAQASGATRYCMGAAWRSPKERDLDGLCAMVRGVKALGLETCMTLGMLTSRDAERLKFAGLDYYNHNIDTSERYYSEIVKTRNFADRLETLDHVRSAGLKVCCGGILGMGEEAADRVAMLMTLAKSSAASRERSDQPSDPHRRHAARKCAAARPDRLYSHNRGRPHHDAAFHGAALGGAVRHER